MKKMFIYLVLLIVLTGIAFFVWSKAPRLEDARPAQGVSSVRMTTEEMHEETEGYIIDVRYPQFGIASIDAAIRTRVEQAVGNFKEYPLDLPSEDAIPKNELSISYSDAYIGSDYASVAIMMSEYTGGAHPNSNIVAVNVDLATGQEVTLERALALIGKSLEQAAAETNAELSARLGSAFFSEGAEASPRNYGTYLIGEDTVTFVFNPYQVGPYASGAQKVEFTRAK